MVKYYETYDAKDHVFICMELLTGGDLEHKLYNTFMTERQIATIMHKLLKAVNHLHEAGVIHRDIKPSNVMFNHKGEVKLIDFSFAIIRRKEQTQKQVIGTPYYIAPEVLSGHYNQQADIWSLGVLFYQMLTR